MQLYDLSIGDITDNYALWLDFRAIYENALHVAGRRIENTPERVTLQIEKSAESAGALKAHIYLTMDAQFNIKNEAFHSVNY